MKEIEREKEKERKSFWLYYMQLVAVPLIARMGLENSLKPSPDLNLKISLKPSRYLSVAYLKYRTKSDQSLLRS